MREKISNLREKMIKKLQSRAARENGPSCRRGSKPDARTRRGAFSSFFFFACVVLLRFFFFYLSLSLSFSEQRAFFFFDNEPNSRREEKCAR